MKNTKDCFKMMKWIMFFWNKLDAVDKKYMLERLSA